MPSYVIIKLKGKGRSQKTVMVGLVTNKKSVRCAWSFYKKNFKRSLNKDWTYYLFPINHSRKWEFIDKKWRIGSWLGNHNQREYRKKMTKFFLDAHKNRQQVNSKGKGKER